MKKFFGAAVYEKLKEVEAKDAAGFEIDEDLFDVLDMYREAGMQQRGHYGITLNEEPGPGKVQMFAGDEDLEEDYDRYPEEQEIDVQEDAELDSEAYDGDKGADAARHLTFTKVIQDPEKALLEWNAPPPEAPFKPLTGMDEMQTLAYYRLISDPRAKQKRRKQLAAMAGMREHPYKVFTVQPILRDKQGKAQALTNRTPKSLLTEAEGLIDAMDYHKPAGSSTKNLSKKPHPLRFFGKGQVKDLIREVQEYNEMNEVPVDKLFVNVNRLSVTQVDHLQAQFDEAGLDIEIMDRYGVILNIFVTRAETKEAKIQVQLAKLQYEKSRIVDAAQNLDQQGGGHAFIGGAGEKLLETRRRTIQREIMTLKNKLEKIVKMPQSVRDHRSNSSNAGLQGSISKTPMVALVGYTNVGKTELSRQLTGEKKFEAESRLFATLDRKKGRLRLPSGLKASLVDTVGFVADLPHDLVAAFASTLHHVKEADMIVHVRDITSPDDEAQKNDVERVLRRQLKLPQERMDSIIEVWNKADLVENPDKLVEFAADDKNVVVMSAKTGWGSDVLKQLLDKSLRHVSGMRDIKIYVDAHQSQDIIAWVYKNSGAVKFLDEASIHGQRYDMSLSVPMESNVLAQFRSKFPNVVWAYV
eukprot:Clim_evm11s200 gene=Clim_evmTU11s200